MSKDYRDDSAVAEPCGIASALHRGQSCAGYHGIAVALSYGRALAGHYGVAVAGDYGTARAGACGVALAGRDGRACADEDGVVAVQWFDIHAHRVRLAVGYVGENGIKPNVFYRCDREGKLVEDSAESRPVGVDSVGEPRTERSR